MELAAPEAWATRLAWPNPKNSTSLPFALKSLMKSIHCARLAAAAKIHCTLDHKWGRTGLYMDPDLQAFPVRENKRYFPSAKTRYDAKRKEKATKKSLTAEEILELAEFALQHGLQEKFDFEMSELVKNFPKTPQAEAFVKYEKDFKRSDIKDDCLHQLE